MCPNPISARKYDERDLLPVKKNGVAKCLAYTPPEYKTNKGGCYIEFYAYDPGIGKMRRKRIKVNHIDGLRQRKQYAKECIARFVNLLREGWNPWIDCDPDDIAMFLDCLEKYDEYVTKQHTGGLFRKQTYDDYKSKIKIIRRYVNDVQKPKERIRYMFQFTKRWCVDFLDYIYIERNNGAQTYNNYLSFLKTLCDWWIARGMLVVNPTVGIQPISKRLFAKERGCIPIDRVKEIGEFTEQAVIPVTIQRMEWV